MKKNVMMRVAALLLVCVMATTCGVSGTFAKYVSSATASAEARVAKWGVEFVTTSVDMFKPQYDYKTIPNGVAGTLSVLANTDVVAPGTEGTGYSFTTAHPMGLPEVSYAVTFDVQDGFETIYVDSYYPIIYTLSLTGVADVESSDLSAVMTALEKCQYMFDVETKHYYVSTDGGTNWTDVGTAIPALSLSWEWVYSVNPATDVLDTQLGNLAAGYTLAQVGASAANLEIAFTIVATATQID